MNRGVGGYGQGYGKGSNEIRGVKHYKLLNAVAPGRTAITTHPRALPRILCPRPVVTVSALALGLDPEWGHCWGPAPPPPTHDRSSDSHVTSACVFE